MTLLEKLRWVAAKGSYAWQAADRIEEKLAEVERLRAGFQSEEEQEYCHNEVTGLHNMADLYHIEELQSKNDKLRDALYDIAYMDPIRRIQGDAQKVAKRALEYKE